MTAKLDYRWQLRTLMATRGMFATIDLKPLLLERGVELSDSQIYRLVAERPERLSLKVLMALIDILGCRMEELIEPVTAARPRRATGTSDSKGTRGGGGERGVAGFRPKRARVARREP